MELLITGATGFIGAAACRHFLAAGHRVTALTRDRDRARHRLPAAVHVVESLSELPTGHAPSVIVNLAGENLGSGRWNAARKQRFLTSRVGVTERVVDYIAQAQPKPELLISGSAVGYYGARGDELIDEAAGPADEYQSELCQAWETAARQAETYGVRVCRLRAGAVLGPGGGPLAGLLPMFHRGLGAYVGDGRQWLSWIHIADWLGLVEHLIEHPTLNGAFNTTAPEPVTNREFAHTLATSLDRRCRFRVPGWLVRLQAGEMAHLFVTGQRVVPRRALESGYQFRYPNLDAALRQILTS